jgi:hypothetical protein
MWIKPLNFLNFLDHFEPPPRLRQGRRTGSAPLATCHATRQKSPPDPPYIPP